MVQASVVWDRSRQTRLTEQTKQLLMTPIRHPRVFVMHLLRAISYLSGFSLVWPPCNDCYHLTNCPVFEKFEIH